MIYRNESFELILFFFENIFFIRYIAICFHVPARRRGYILGTSFPS